MKSFKRCLGCDNRVGEGERHAAGSCPPRAKPGNNRRARKVRGRKRHAQAGAQAPQRGTPIAGTGRPRSD